MTRVAWMTVYWILFWPRSGGVDDVAVTRDKGLSGVLSTDMRKGLDGLSAEVTRVLRADPFCGHLFLSFAASAAT